MDLRQIGKYKIVEQLGKGAMGEVFRAHDPVLSRDVAIKIVTGKLSGEDRTRERFLREARSAAGLNHPNVITVFDFGEEPQPWMAMELLGGRDLRQILEKDEIPSLEDRLAIMEQILDGLAFAHANGVVHRDLKPGNVRVLPDGRVKIMDFGLAQREDAAATGPVMGTPYYMAPEQVQGERSSARADVFSAGAMFYELLGKKRPFTGTTIPAVLYAVVNREPSPLGELVPDLPPGVAAVVMRALAKSPDARWADGTEMREALRAAWSMPEGWMEDSAPVYTSANGEMARDLGPPPSAREDTPAELRAAIAEINQYLDDRVPPLMAADSVATFSEASVDGGAAEILGWAARQQQRQPDLPAVDLLFHALHKLSVVGVFQLVNREKLLAFLRSVGVVLAEACPAGPERERFRRALSHLGEWETVSGGPIELKHLRQGEGEDLPPLTGTPGLRRLSHLEQRLRRETAARGEGAARARRRVISQAITAAATEAKSEQELESLLQRLRKSGVAAGPEQAFRNLGQELANWVIPKHVSDTADLGPPNEVQAMKKIVSLAEDPVEVARRYRFLVTAAIEQFNEGHLGRAMQMFDLARKLAVEKKIERGFTEPIIRKGHEALDPVRLRQFMDTPDRHPQLQSVMAFFEVGLGAKILLDQLETESRRDRRRLILDLLVVHGEAGRALARARLLASLGTTATDFARRNWIYLLRLVPRPANEPAEPEVSAVARFAAPGSPVFLIKEALTYLSQTRHPRVADALVSLLGTWERELDQDELDATAEEEGFSILDRLAAALARQGGPKGWRALVSHALSRRPELGATMSRLTELGSQDLSPSPDVVATLVEEVQEGLPRGVFGRLVGRRDQDLPLVVGALAGTRTPAVRTLLEDLKKRYSGQEIGKAAVRALEAPPAFSGPAPVAGHSGDLDPGSLPALLHRLGQGKATGMLSLMPRESGAAPATIGIAQGRPVSAQWAHRSGAEAFYQIFERAFAGTYAFETAARAPSGTLPELAELVKEGVRRARELQRTSAVVPEDLPLEATGAAPGTVVEEADYDLIVALWAKACAGVTVSQIEAELAADSFRIHRPLAQWLEEGALRITPLPAEASAPPAPATPAT